MKFSPTPGRSTNWGILFFSSVLLAPIPDLWPLKKNEIVVRSSKKLAFPKLPASRRLRQRPQQGGKCKKPLLAESPSRRVLQCRQCAPRQLHGCFWISVEVVVSISKQVVSLEDYSDYFPTRQYNQIVEGFIVDKVMSNVWALTIYAIYVPECCSLITLERCKMIQPTKAISEGHTLHVFPLIRETETHAITITVAEIIYISNVVAILIVSYTSL